MRFWSPVVLNQMLLSAAVLMLFTAALLIQLMWLKAMKLLAFSVSMWLALTRVVDIVYHSPP